MAGEPAGGWRPQAVPERSLQPFDPASLEPFDPASLVAFDASTLRPWVWKGAGGPEDGLEPVQKGPGSGGPPHGRAEAAQDGSKLLLAVCRRRPTERGRAMPIDNRLLARRLTAYLAARAKREGLPMELTPAFFEDALRRHGIGSAFGIH